MFELIVCDLDGTLANTRDDLAIAVNHVRECFGLNKLDNNIITGFLGDGADILLRKALGEKYDGNKEEALSIFREYYLKNIFKETVLYPNVEDTLIKLKNKNIKLAVLSNKPEQHCRKLLRELGIDKLFLMIVGGDTYKTKKPDAMPLIDICEKLNISTENTLMIGDHVNDIQCAKDCDAKVVVVDYGFTDINELNILKPDYSISDFSEILKLI